MQSYTYIIDTNIFFSITRMDFHLLPNQNNLADDFSNDFEPTGNSF